jgi:membrane dipeptidase
LRLATTSHDVLRAKREATVAVFIGVEGGHAIENSLDRLRELYRRGVRYLTLTWNNGNDWAGSSIGEHGTRTGGLTDFGRDVVREMNGLGMLVDISHVSDATFDDVVATARAPIIASHSGARAIAAHPRNLSDDMLRAVARSGGVVNVNFFSVFLDPAIAAHADRLRVAIAAEEEEALARPGADRATVRAEHERMLRDRLQATPRPPFSILIDHIDHIARVAGVAHVGLGSDFDGVDHLLPAGMLDVTYLPNIAQGLIDRGYRDADVTRVLGGNMLRVMSAVLDRAAPEV